MIFVAPKTRVMLKNRHEDSPWAAFFDCNGDGRLGVDDLKTSELSDPETQQVKGMGGPKDSNMELTVLKCGLKWPLCDEVTVKLQRNIWSARHLATPQNTDQPWTGTDR